MDMTVLERARLASLVLAVMGAVSLTARAQVPPPSPSTESPRFNDATTAPEVQPLPATDPPGPTFRPPPAGPGPELRFHGGFFLRLQIGIGFTTLRGSGGYLGAITVSGGGGLLGVAIGGGVTRNLAVFGSLFASRATNPDFTTGGVDAGRNGGSAAVGGVGVGLVRYFEPLNVYVSGELASVSMMIQNTQGTIDQSKYGLGIEGSVGKEWWLSRHWGLGAAAELLCATGMMDKYDSNLDWSAVVANLLISATYF